jgi:hypothetical protein
LLVDLLEVVVEYDPPNPSIPPLTTAVPIPLSMFSAAADVWARSVVGNPAEIVDEAYQALVNTANG